MIQHHPYYGLTALVQYRRKVVGVVWNNMAAFDSMEVAEDYARQCSGKSDPASPWEYRAIEVSNEVAYADGLSPHSVSEDRS